jgi:hypothetical protein
LSPILVRPVREQLEHDRVIRLLQAKYKKKFEVAINPGHEQTMPIGTGTSAWYPDLVLQSSDRHRKLAGVVEVETTESVNHLEAMSQWAAFTRFRVPFHLYVPVGSVDTARRFCADLNISVAEIWAYQAVSDQLRFTLVQRVPPATAKTKRAGPVESRPRPRPPAGTSRGSGEPARTAARRTHSPVARPRASGPTTSRPSRASAAGARRASLKAKAAPSRRSAPKPAKGKTGGSSRAAKRR